MCPGTKADGGAATWGPGRVAGRGLCARWCVCPGLPKPWSSMGRRAPRSRVPGPASLPWSPSQRFSPARLHAAVFLVLFTSDPAPGTEASQFLV